MGNELSGAGCCAGPGGLARHEEHFGHVPEPMPIVGTEALKQDRISEWSEPGAADRREELWWCECGQPAGLADGPGGGALPLQGPRGAAYLVADTPDGATLMSTERGDGAGTMWLGDTDGEARGTLRPVWDPLVRKEFHDHSGTQRAKEKD
mmetsp:Transcript_66182/g.204915  ORF Transcript_66182/g.204915 Transcript_66182/m.204915 type:complete len:151 (+) Transcript_66182:127-579(+)